MRLRSLLAAAGLITAGLVAATPAANAAGTCSLYVPSKFSISQPYRAINVVEGPNCASAGVVDAAWLAYHPTQGVVNGAIFENSARTEVVELYDTMPLGRWTWRPEGAYTAADAEVPQYTYNTDVRLASYARVTAARSGSRVTIRTTAMRYWVSGERFIGWNGARGIIQYRTPGTTTWRSLKEVFSNTAGVYSYSYTSAAARDYRVVTRATGVIWESTSPAVRK